MIYKSVSIENVIARVIRNTRFTDTSAINDLYEWIPEAMELLETQYEMEPSFEDLTIKFHQAKMPCGVNILDAVEYNGKRLALSNTVRDVKAGQQASAEPVNTTVLQSVVGIIANSVTGRLNIYTSLQQVNLAPTSSSNFYYTKLDYVCTSMKEAQIRVFYRKGVTDDNGNPIIPDNGNYKEAMYWWVRGKLIGSGQLDDSKNSEDSCLAKFEMYAARAIGEITYPSIDRMELLKSRQVRFLPPANFWSNYNNV